MFLHQRVFKIFLDVHHKFYVEHDQQTLYQCEMVYQKYVHLVKCPFRVVIILSIYPFSIVGSGNGDLKLR